MRRLFEDPELPSALRDDLVRSRVAGEAYDVTSKLPQLRAALSDPSRQPLEDDVSHAASATKASFGVPAAWKLMLVVAAIGGTAVLIVRPASRPAPAKPATVQPVVVAPAPPSAAPAIEVVPTPQTAPVPEASPRAVDRSPPASGSSRREIAQLVRIRRLIARNPAAAYRLARQSQAEFPQGVLSEEREALLVVALAKSGAPGDAAREAQAFFARHPQSPMRELIEAALQR